MKPYYRRYFRKNSQEESTMIDLTPLIDMIFLLLIFFLLTSMIVRPSLAVTLPEAEGGQGGTSREIVVTIDTEQTIWIGEEEVPFASLLSELQRRMEESSRVVTISADRYVPYGSVIRLADIASRAGAEEIGFMVDIPRDQQ